MTNGFIIAATASGTGKTTLTLALLRALRNQGVAVASAKSGPDFIDPAFHAAASGRTCINLDPWAMRPDYLRGLAHGHETTAELMVIEGAMGLFDGAVSGVGSTADLAALLGLPVVLVLDVKGQSQTAAALVRGMRDHRADVTTAGVLLNRVGSPRHEAMIRPEIEALGVPVLGAIPADKALALPSRHLGLVQAGEHEGLEAFLNHAADLISQHVDLEQLQSCGAAISPSREPKGLAPLGQRIAVARDQAFAFAYPHLLDGWHRQGAEIIPFSPLADEAPDEACDAVYLPGGYPELHGARLAGNAHFLDGLRNRAEQGALIYGECGGYMVLGNALIDGDGVAHAMVGLLPLETSFADPQRHLGYRKLKCLDEVPWVSELKGHEFHYTTSTDVHGLLPLFSAQDASGAELPPMGMRVGRIMGSYAHVIDQV